MKKINLGQTITIVMLGNVDVIAGIESFGVEQGRTIFFWPNIRRSSIVDRRAELKAMNLSVGS